GVFILLPDDSVKNKRLRPVGGACSEAFHGRIFIWNGYIAQCIFPRSSGQSLSMIEEKRM
ncbi:MAG: hypothetical protein Q4C47_06700, partial [Planctomycetia bacterium]|nr:hypothetical protein [Planctomycetia bacterium]